MKTTQLRLNGAAAHLLTLILVLAMSGQSAFVVYAQKDRRAQKGGEVTDTGILPGPMLDPFGPASKTEPSRIPEVGMDLGSESEPNNTAATADILTAAEGRIKGSAWNEAVATDGTDTDFYAFTTTAPTRVFAATETSFSASGTDSTLDLIASDGTTVLETDLNDGTFSTSSSSISGAVLAAPGTYYLRVTNVSTTSPIAPYFLYFAVQGAAPIVEVEPNNSGGTPNPLPASGFVTGTVNPAGDNDTFSVNLNAGDTVFASLNIDPERDNVQWNGRLGMGLFGNPQNFLVISDGSVGSATNPLSEAFFMTVRTSGSYLIYVDDATLGGSATATYNLNVMVLPAPALSCTTFTNATPTPIADLALTSSTINVPGSPIIRRARVYLDITHTNTADLDLHLVSPAGNDNGLFTDIATVAAQVAPQINFGLDDNAGITVGNYTVNSGMIWQPELAYRLDWFSGENAGGNWRLDIRDDTTANTGTLNSWSLELCTDPAPTGNLIYSENFEGGMGGFTHSGTLDEWAFGTPNTPGTTTTNPVAAFTNCASGVNCWKTDLTGTYENSSSQDLVSPILNLGPFSGIVTLYWQQRYQMESVTFDRIWVRVTEVGNPANTRIVWSNTNATMTNTAGNPLVNIAASAGWGRYNADISDFAGLPIQITFHLDSDSSIPFAGWAVDDIQLFQAGPVAAHVGVSGRVTDTKGNPIARAYVSLTGSDGIPRVVRTNTFGHYRFEQIEVGEAYLLDARAKGYSFVPRIISVNDEVTDADMIALE